MLGEQVFKDEKLRGSEESTWFLPKDNLPIVGQIPEGMSNEELSSQLDTKSVGRVKIFDLSDEEDLKEYEGLIQKRANGEISFGRVEIKWVDEIENWKVLAHWERFYREFMEGDQKKKREVVNRLG